MSKRGLAVLLAGLCLFSITVEAQINLVHVTPCGPQTFPASSCSVPSTGNGNLLVVGWQIGGGANTSTTIQSITDNVGNIYTASGSLAIDTSTGSVADIWYAKNVVPGATSILITPSASVTNGGAVIWEFSGANTSAPLDHGAALNSQGASTVAIGAAVTTTSANEVIVSLAPVATDVGGISAGNGFTNDSTLKGNGWAHLFAAGPGTYSAQWILTRTGTYASSTAAFKAASSSPTSYSACDLDQDGTVNPSDVPLAINMALGSAPCTANISGSGGCNIVMVQDVINAMLSGTCGTGTGTVSHSVSLNWIASSSSNVAGYNVYRGSVSGGPYTKMNSSLVVGTSFTDSNVTAGQTYYYVCTAVDTSNNESAYSGPPAAATIPTP